MAEGEDARLGLGLSRASYPIYFFSNDSLSKVAWSNMQAKSGMETQPQRHFPRFLKGC